MQKPILIFPAGSEIGIEIFHSCKYSHINLFGASGKSDHAEFIYDEKSLYREWKFIYKQWAIYLLF